MSLERLTQGGREPGRRSKEHFSLSPQEQFIQDLLRLKSYKAIHSLTERKQYIIETANQFLFKAGSYLAQASTARRKRIRSTNEQEVERINTAATAYLADPMQLLFSPPDVQFNRLSEYDRAEETAFYNMTLTRSYYVNGYSLEQLAQREKRSESKDDIAQRILTTVNNIREALNGNINVGMIDSAEMDSLRNLALSLLPSNSSLAYKISTFMRKKQEREQGSSNQLSEISLSEIPFFSQIKKRLEAAGITSFGQIAALDHKKLASISGLTPENVQDIQEVLERLYIQRYAGGQNEIRILPSVEYLEGSFIISTKDFNDFCSIMRECAEEFSRRISAYFLIIGRELIEFRYSRYPRFLYGIMTDEEFYEIFSFVKERLMEKSIFSLATIVNERPDSEMPGDTEEFAVLGRRIGYSTDATVIDKSEIEKELGDDIILKWGSIHSFGGAYSDYTEPMFIAYWKTEEQRERIHRWALSHHQSRFTIVHWPKEKELKPTAFTVETGFCEDPDVVVPLLLL